ncbi:MAG: hypothetical protein BKP49_02975 [Treponema sp. CETP13]|nr:MAG: hypothetical protein BKP49_02975 [Treponema sp. CETP13]
MLNKNLQNTKFDIRFFILCSIFFVVTSPFASCSAPPKLKTQTLTITRFDKSTITLVAEIAKTEEEKEYGFMNRKDIPDGTGMLFVYKKDIHLSFWMKNTPLPLSIAYIDSKGIIRELYDMTPYSLAPIIGQYACRYALEVPQGWFSANNITVNSKIDLSSL